MLTSMRDTDTFAIEHLVDMLLSHPLSLYHVPACF